MQMIHGRLYINISASKPYIRYINNILVYKRRVIMEIYEICEMVMIISFGASWPLNVIKSYKARTAKGKSLGFLCLILIGYVVGITGKLINEKYMSSLSSNWYVLFFYFLNLIMVFIDFLLYFRNRKLDKKATSNI